MKMKKIALAAVLIPLALGSASAMAFGGGKGGEQRGGMDNRMLRQLDLTDEQKDQLKEIAQTQRAAKRSAMEENRDVRMAEMQAAKTAELDLVLAADFDEAQAQELASKMVEMQQSRYVEKLELQHEMMSVLTDEQKAELKTLQAERMAEMAEKDGKDGKGGKKGGKKGW
jgi:protein CpxP